MIFRVLNRHGYISAIGSKTFKPSYVQEKIIHIFLGDEYVRVYARMCLLSCI